MASGRPASPACPAVRDIAKTESVETDEAEQVHARIKLRMRHIDAFCRGFRGPPGGDYVGSAAKQIGREAGGKAQTFELRFVRPVARSHALGTGAGAVESCGGRGWYRTRRTM